MERNYQNLNSSIKFCVDTISNKENLMKILQMEYQKIGQEFKREILMLKGKCVFDNDNSL